MHKIIIKGYIGLNKVAMTKAIKKHTNLNLNESKKYTDTLLEKGNVTIEINSKESALQLITELREANANAELLSE